MQIATKLRHFGVMHGFVLATSKFNANPEDYSAIRNMKRQLAIRAREQAKEQGKQHEEVERCTPVGKRGVDMMLSSFRVYSRRAFQRLRRADRHHLFATVMQHTGGGMRFGQSHERDYTVESFVQDARDGSFRLVTDYSRYAGRRQFCIEFPTHPRYKSMWYEVRRPDGTVEATFTAATLMQWHFDELRRNGERQVFKPIVGRTTSRDARQTWKRQALLAALPLHERAARELVNDVSPHSFRAGIAGDVAREGHSLQTIGSICRWNSMKAIRLYAERPCLSMFRKTENFRVMTDAR